MNLMITWKKVMVTEYLIKGIFIYDILDERP